MKDATDRHRLSDESSASYTRCAACSCSCCNSCLRASRWIQVRAADTDKMRIINYRCHCTWKSFIPDIKRRHRFQWRVLYRTRSPAGLLVQVSEVVQFFELCFNDSLFARRIRLPTLSWWWIATWRLMLPTSPLTPQSVTSVELTGPDAEDQSNLRKQQFKGHNELNEQ